MNGILIRDSQPGDLDSVSGLYPQAFPDEDLVPLVETLLQEGQAVLSLVGVEGTDVVAHVIFTLCGIEGSAGKAALLAPLAVAPSRQRRGIGSQIVRAGIQRMEEAAVSQIFVLGDPAYYSRFGFAKETSVTPPYPLPVEWDGAWQSLMLGNKVSPGAGRLSVPKPWREKKLWAP